MVIIIKYISRNKIKIKDNNKKKKNFFTRIQTIDHMIYILCNVRFSAFGHRHSLKNYVIYVTALIEYISLE